VVSMSRVIRETPQEIAGCTGAEGRLRPWRELRGLRGLRGLRIGTAPAPRIALLFLLGAAALLLLGASPVVADEVEGDDTYSAPDEDESADEEAEDEGEARKWGRPGAYVGLGGFYALQNFRGTQNVNNLLIPLQGMSDGNGLDARLGYRINRWASFEWFFAWATGFDRKVSGGSADLQTYGYGMSAKFYPTDWIVQPYAVAGFGGLTTSLGTNTGGSDVETGFLGRVGAGVDFYVTPNIVVEVEGTYLMSAGPTSDFRYAMLGGNLQYRF